MSMSEKRKLLFLVARFSKEMTSTHYLFTRLERERIEIRIMLQPLQI